MVFASETLETGDRENDQNLHPITKKHLPRREKRVERATNRLRTNPLFLIAYATGAFSDVDEMGRPDIDYSDQSTNPEDCGDSTQVTFEHEIQPAIIFHGEELPNCVIYKRYHTMERNSLPTDKPIGETTEWNRIVTNGYEFKPTPIWWDGEGVVISHRPPTKH